MAADLISLPVKDPQSGAWLGVVDTPRGSRNKYKYDPELACFRLSKTLPQGMVFPFDFGFIPSTKGADGDPLDILLLLDASMALGCALPFRIIGALEAEQRESGKDWVRNDRLLGVGIGAHLHAHLQSIDELDSKFLDELEAFFVQYNRLVGKEFRVIARVGPQQAEGHVHAASH